MDFIAIDFETATSETNSAYSIGIACVDKSVIVHSEHHLIQPPTLAFSKKNIDINGIMPEHVMDAPKFPEVWEMIQHYFDETTLVFAHNARFDMSVLKRSFEHYNMVEPIVHYACSIPFSTRACTGAVPGSLEARAAFFGIDMGTHHSAESDARTCAQLVIETIKYCKYSYRSFAALRRYLITERHLSELNPMQRIGRALYDQIDYKNMVDLDGDDNNDAMFENKNVVITGEFKSISKRDLAQAMVNKGAVIKSGVSKTTNFLIVGAQDKRIVGADGLSNKQEKAYELIEQGHKIEIYDESQILEILSE